MKGKKTTPLQGGTITNPFKQIEVFFSLIILGYFGVKVVYGTFFQFYPQKYYYRNLEINSTSSSSSEDSKNKDKENTNQLVLNAYMPGMWNSEITDFVVAIILSLIIFIYTSMPNRSMISEEGNLNPALLFGYILGCGYPPIKHNLEPLINRASSSSLGQNIFNCFGILLFIFLVTFIIIANYFSMNNESNSYVGYLTYVCAIILLIFGLYFGRKVSATTTQITYNMSQGSNCSKADQKYVKSSGERLKISTTFVVFILLMLFSFSPTNPAFNYGYTFIYGILLGIFISGISYYGIEYFLVKQPEKTCNSYAQCENTDADIATSTDNENINNLIEEKRYDSNSFSVIKLMLVISLLLILVYLGYKYIYH